MQMIDNRKETRTENGAGMSLLSGILRTGPCFLAFAIFSASFSSGALADTIFLKNGSWIDGTLGFRTDKFIEFKIGKVGKIVIPLEDVYLIEKNNRTGEKMVETYVDPRGKVELPQGKQREKKPKPPGETSESTPVSGEEKDPGATSSPGSVEEEELDPELKARIEKYVSDLQRQKTNFRVRAERHLKGIGRPAIPFLIPLTDHENDLTRIAVMRLFLSFGDERVIEPCIRRLLDLNEYVRDFANKTLKRVTGEDFGFRAFASPRRRELAYNKWLKWWKSELKALEEEKEKAASK